MNVYEQLKAAAPEAWAAYTDHEFIRQMEAGDLPAEAFRAYLVQDYLFLVQFARAYALAVYKSRSLPQIEAAQAGLAGIVQETELHVRLCARFGLEREDLDRAAEHPATVAYTRYVLDCGSSGDLLDLHVALLPCVAGYAEIGRRLAPAIEDDVEHPYREWIAEYNGPQYQQLAQDAVATIEELAQRSLTEARFPELASIFATATSLEADFWQMGLDLGAAGSATGR